MKEISNQDCPLCSNQAIFYFVDFGERKYFNCPSCSKFLITRRAEVGVKEGSDGGREKLSKLPANAPEGFVLDISVRSPTSENVSQNISFEYISKDTLRL